MTTWLYEVGITLSCKTTLNIPSYCSYLKLAKLCIVLHEILTLLHTAMRPCEANDKWHSTMKYILCSVKEGGNGVDFRPESRLMTLRDLKQENDVKCI